ncbi:hypothetical protein SAMN05216470_2024 [Streptococcus equinus]|uniref:WDGH domain-containing protein n=1 Tax=Streptococcus equinus TaxID=1335 RepID=A0A239RG38_STREI|nr:hypothetical protein [Streptococcus equinus]SNU09797.1 hypothetical protein SAMN05216470_2024 [Streptococcus equinus]
MKFDIPEEEYLHHAQFIIDEKLNRCRGLINDGSHSFNELYYHRMILFAAICNKNKANAWKSKKHADGSMYDNYFIVGIETPEGQYSYHYHIDNWNFFDVKELERAPEWDGHQPKDVTRLLSL